MPFTIKEYRQGEYAATTKASSKPLGFVDTRTVGFLMIGKYQRKPERTYHFKK